MNLKLIELALQSFEIGNLKDNDRIMNSAVVDVGVTSTYFN